MTVGQAVKSLRLAGGLMQREVAKRVGITASMLSLVEADKREPSISVLRGIGRALGVPTGVLFAIALQDDELAQGTAAARKNQRFVDELFAAALDGVAARRRKAS